MTPCITDTCNQNVDLCLKLVVLFWVFFNSAAFSLDTEQPDYDLDSDDDMFVNKLKKKMELSQLQFEEMIDRLEKGSGQQVGTLGLFICEINLQMQLNIDH